ncbi:RTX toxin transporter [Clostridium zeae]|uniref:RTX toxin transporter n=1 Tax=Clostridium zeae TaxID=2759022 RepID=A0ABQ1ED00_9CLOT|nr:HlyD family efflux transporter periplasmic adaptor subunit [Clostridium zeae]GFZ32672.1 RTX toxin transporter [Clostridium zeae]
MNNIILDLDEITDSKEMLEAKPHKFINIFIYIIIVFLSSALIWAYFSETEIVVKANGIVRSITENQRVINPSTGRVESVNLKDGQDVRKGDILYTIEHTSLNLQKENYEKQIDNINNEIINLKKLSDSINNNKNYFDYSDPKEKEYYNKFLKYKNDIDDANNQSDLSKDQAENQVNILQSQVNETQSDLDNLELLEKSINEGINYLKKGSSYYSQYLDYDISVSNYKKKIDEIQSQYDNIKGKSGVGTEQLDTVQINLGDAKDDLIKYKNQFNTNLISSLEQDKKKLNELRGTLDNTNDLFNKTLNSSKTSLEKYKLSMLTQIDDTIKADESKLQELKVSLQQIKLNIESYIIKASIDGKISIDTNISKDDMIQAGMDIATIVPKESSQFKVQLSVANSDIANIKEGQNVKYHFAALPYKEYGELQGRISNVGIDSKLDTRSGTSYYSAEGVIDNKTVYSYKGEKAQIKVGMLCEAQVVTRKEKIIYRLLEKINFK